MATSNKSKYDSEERQTLIYDQSQSHTLQQGLAR